MIEKETSFLQISLNRNNPEVSSSFNSEIKDITFNGIEYFLSDSDKGTNGFYDWLRDKDSNIIGVRYYLFDDCWILNNEKFIGLMSESFPHFNFDNDKRSLELYITSEDEVDEEKSDDQDFGTNLILIAKNGDLLLMFDIGELSEKVKGLSG